MTKTLEELREEFGITVANENEDPVDAETGLTLSEKARLSAQGLLMNFSDEAIAATRSLFSDETYDEAVADERAQLKTAQDKPGSLKYEIGGGIATGLLAAPFTGGASLAPTLGRVALLSAGDALISAIGTEEGNIVDRVVDNPGKLALSTAVGTVAGTAGKKLIDVAGAGIKKLSSPAGSLSRFISGKVSKPVEAEVRRIADDSGVPYEQIVKRISEGEVFPDLSEQAAKDVAGLFASSGKGGQRISEVLERRADELPTDARTTMQSDLALGASPVENLTRAVKITEKQLKKETSDDYNKIWNAEASIPGLTIYGELNNIVLDLAKGSRNSRNLINKKLDENGIAPIFKIGENKELELVRELTLKEGEIIKRAFMDAKDSAKRAGTNDRAATMGNYENQIVSVLNSISKPLQETRAKWAKIESLNKAFKDGKKLFGMSSEDAEIFFEDLLADQGAEAVAALRMGVAVALKNKSSTGARTSLIGKLNDLNKKERQILEKIYPEDSAEEAFRKINLADQSLKTLNKVTGGSPTAGRQEAVKRQGSAGVVSNVADAIVTGQVIQPLLRTVKSVLGNKAGLSPKQLNEVAEIIITEDPNIMQKALNDPEIQTLLVNRINQLANLTARGASSASAYEASTGTYNNPTISSLANSISKEAKAKINLATQQ